MNIVFTCGGTGGHIYPAIAVARLFQQRQPGCSILFIGAEDGMENKIVPREGFRLETLKISNFQRKLTPAAIAHNLQTAAHLSESRRKVHRILTSFRPILSSAPVVTRAFRRCARARDFRFRPWSTNQTLCRG
ncbi:MAG: glycosyltransferase [Oscillospiraceae bacterium]